MRRSDQRCPGRCPAKRSARKGLFVVGRKALLCCALEGFFVALASWLACWSYAVHGTFKAAATIEMCARRGHRVG